MFGILPEEVAIGEWLRVKYIGPPLAKVQMKLGDAEWKTCYHDDGDVMIRARGVSGGEHRVLLRRDGEEVDMGVVTIPGKRITGRSSVRLTD